MQTNPQSETPGESHPATGTAAVQDLPQSAPREWRPSGCILVVDDEDLVRAVVARAVTRLGFTADTASNGKQAMGLFEAEPSRYVAAMLDIKMPGMDGMEIMGRLRELRPGLPVVMMSGYSQHGVLSPQANPPTAFLQKPFTVGSLTAGLRSVYDS
jgi:CheY-like chemotaxis protein